MIADKLARRAILLIAFVATTAFIYHLSTAYIFPGPRYDDVGMDPESASDGFGAAMWKGGIEKFKEFIPQVSQETGESFDDAEEEMDVEATEEENQDWIEESRSNEGEEITQQDPVDETEEAIEIIAERHRSKRRHRRH